MQVLLLARLGKQLASGAASQAASAAAAACPGNQYAAGAASRAPSAAAAACAHALEGKLLLGVHPGLHLLLLHECNFIRLIQTVA